MQNLLKFLYTYSFLILFLILEGVSIFLMVENNNFQRASYLQIAQTVTGKFYEQADNIKVYFSLRANNEILAKENIDLRNKLASFRKIIHEKKDSVIDTTYKQRYVYFSAKIINNTVSKQFNYITLNKGARDGVKLDMAVLSPKGIVGVVSGVSESFSTVLPVLNRNFKVSAKLRKSSFFGSLTWGGVSSETCILNDIPHHVQVHLGDTIVTTGYSGIFPEGVPIGVVKKAELKDGNFYTIQVKLTTDFRGLDYVTLVGDLKKQEREVLEKKMEQKADHD
ncbi:MAG: rod shape-determining protein MreC [Bacteroidota bacterium]|nr:rod shape-determining protein MreC [Bacteroidota bacterium]